MSEFTGDLIKFTIFVHSYIVGKIVLFLYFLGDKPIV